MDELVHDLAALLAISNPIGAVPVFLSLTTGMDPGQRRAAVVRASVAVFVILLVSAVVGRSLLQAFGISYAAFRAAGGLIILFMGLEMLRGSPTKVQKEGRPSAAGDDPILVPFVMPLVAGPGAITTVITLTARGHGWQSQLEVFVAIAATAAILFVALLSSGWIARRLGSTGQRVFLRFMGLILAAIGTQSLLSGIKEFFA